MKTTSENHIVNYATIVTGSIPVHETGAFSTGRVGIDWFNHFDRQFGRFTPFGNAGIANGVLNTRHLAQPFRIVSDFRSLGFVADLEGGMNFKIWRGLGIGSSYYALAPAGQQKVYANQNLNNPFFFPNGSKDLSALTHDHGYDAYLRITPTKFLYLEGGYVHSLKFDDDAAYATIGFDFKEIFHRAHP